MPKLRRIVPWKSDEPARRPSLATKPPAKEPGVEYGPHYRRMWIYAVVTAAFVALTPLIVMTVINFRQYQRKLGTEVIYPTHRLVSMANVFIRMFLEERHGMLTYVTNSRSFADLAREGELRRVLANIRRSFSGFADLSLVDARGVPRAYAGDRSPSRRNCRREEWFERVARNGSDISEVEVGRDGTVYTTISVRKDSKPAGSFYILRARASMNTVADYLASLDLRKSGDAFLMSRDGLLQTPSRHGAGSLQRAPIDVPPPRDTPRIVDVAHRDGRNRVLGYAYIPGSPFILVILKHPEAIMQSWVDLKNDILWLLGASILLILGFVVVSATYMVNRIRLADMNRDRARHQIEYSNRMALLGRMATGVAHELNNPLAIINENAGLLTDLVEAADRPVDRERTSRVAVSISDAVKRCTRITHGLLGFARQSDQITPGIAVGPLIEEVVTFQGKEARRRGIKIDINVPADFPAIETDRGRLQQVFINILSNAFAAVPNGGAIAISATRQGDKEIALTISDNGPGISRENLKRIFEPFFSTKGEYGTGLGLAITSSIVDKLGGKIVVHSQEGHGATFAVTLPIARKPEDSS